MLHLNAEKFRVIGMASEDRKPYATIEARYGLNQTAVIILWENSYGTEVLNDAARGLVGVKLNI